MHLFGGSFASRIESCKMPIKIPSSTAVYEFYHSISWIQDGIIFCKYKPDLVIDLRVAKVMVDDRKKISNGFARPFFIDVTDLLSVDTEGRKYLATEGSELVCAGAIYTNNRLLAFVGNSFILLDKPLIPVKVFTSEKAAIRWLEPFKYLS